MVVRAHRAGKGCAHHLAAKHKHEWEGQSDNSDPEPQVEEHGQHQLLDFSHGTRNLGNKIKKGKLT